MVCIWSLSVRLLRLCKISSNILKQIKNEGDCSWNRNPLAFVTVSPSQLQLSPKSSYCLGTTMAWRLVWRAGSNSRKTMYESIRSIHLVWQASFNFWVLGLWSCISSTLSKRHCLLAEKAKNLAIFQYMTPHFWMLGSYMQTPQQDSVDVQHSASMYM